LSGEFLHVEKQTIKDTSSSTDAITQCVALIVSSDAFPSSCSFIAISFRYASLNLSMNAKRDREKWS
jgi:hypothetical protein